MNWQQDEGQLCISLLDGMKQKITLDTAWHGIERDEGISSFNFHGTAWDGMGSAELNLLNLPNQIPLQPRSFLQRHVFFPMDCNTRYTPCLLAARRSHCIALHSIAVCRAVPCRAAYLPI